VNPGLLTDVASRSPNAARAPPPSLPPTMQRYQKLLDDLVPFLTIRWVVLVISFVGYLVRNYMLQVRLPAQGCATKSAGMSAPFPQLNPRPHPHRTRAMESSCARAGGMCSELTYHLFSAGTLQGWYIVTYALGIYLLNLFIAFLSPKVDPAFAQYEGVEGPVPRGAKLASCIHCQHARAFVAWRTPPVLMCCEPRDC